MRHNHGEYRAITKEFPTLVCTNGKPICSIEIDISVLYEEDKVELGGMGWLIQTIVATWVKINGYAKQGTIWERYSPSVNFEHSSHVMFYAVLGMPRSFRDYLNDELEILKGCVRLSSDSVVPNRDDGWEVLCHIEDKKTWKELNPSLWQAIKLEADDEPVVYKNCKTIITYSDHADKEKKRGSSEVKIGENEIIISFSKELDLAMYKGKRLSEGSFIIEYPEYNFRVTLYIFSGCNTLTGFWVEGESKGLWFITLG